MTIAPAGTLTSASNSSPDVEVSPRETPPVSPGFVRIHNQLSSMVHIQQLSSSPRQPSAGGAADQPYRPEVFTTLGSRRPACLVNASVTYVNEGQIYSFGGFDRHTDEVYNHLLKLDLKTREWDLVDNYGDIPGVRMGHSTNLWQGDKLIVFGGENEGRIFLNDVHILELDTHTWTRPEVRGPEPPGRARHSAVIDDERLWITGGAAGLLDDSIMDDVCYLDLRTFTWSPTWTFASRYDHSSWVWNGRLWLFGGMNQGMQRNSELWWLDIRDTTSFDTEGPAAGSSPAPRQLKSRAPSTYRNRTNGSNIGRRTTSVPGSVASLKFLSTPNLPVQTEGRHFHIYTSGCLLDINTPSDINTPNSRYSPAHVGLASLDLDSLKWSKLAECGELFQDDYRWHYCAVSQDGTNAWLLGSSCDLPAGQEECLGEFMHIDFQKFGLPGNSIISDSLYLSVGGSPGRQISFPTYPPGIGADLALCFDQPPESGSGSDFIITAEPDFVDSLVASTPVAGSDGEAIMSDGCASSKPEIHVHKLILQARWPHFSRLYAAEMQEYHTNRMHIPEPYSAVRAFLLYLYTDSIGPAPKATPLRTPGHSNGASSAGSTIGSAFGQKRPAIANRFSLTNAPDRHMPRPPTISEVAGMLVLASLYDMSRLRVLCVHRLVQQMNVEQAAVIWDRAREAGEGWLKRRAALFCMQNWGRVVRTRGFRSLEKMQIIELCQQADPDAHLVKHEEVDLASPPAWQPTIAAREGSYRPVLVPEVETDVTSDEMES